MRQLLTLFHGSNTTHLSYGVGKRPTLVGSRFVVGNDLIGN